MYGQFASETGEKYGSFEVFHHDGVRFSDDDCWADSDGNPMPAGWYWWACFPVCMPDSDPNGPFDTEAEATADARNSED
jgi:hypothetical protein